MVLACMCHVRYCLFFALPLTTLRSPSRAGISLFSLASTSIMDSLNRLIHSPLNWNSLAPSLLAPQSIFRRPLGPRDSKFQKDGDFKDHFSNLNVEDLSVYF